MQSLASNGHVSLILGSTSRIRNATKPRSLSAYPLGTLHPQPMVNRERSNFPKERSFSIIDDGGLPGFSVGPCYLLKRQTRSNSSTAKLTMEDLLVPVNEISFVEKGDKSDETQKVISRLNFADLDDSMCSSECDQHSKEYSLDNNLKIVSIKQKVMSKGHKKYRSTQKNQRKGKQNYTKHTAGKKHKSNNRNLSAKQNQQIKQSKNKEIKDKAYEIFVTSNNLQPALNTSLPSIRAKNNYSPNAMRSLSLKVSSHSLPDELAKVGTMEKLSNHFSKIYLSEKQSGNLMGIPAVPPCTPLYDGACPIEFVPSMSDIKSQRFMVERLSQIWKKRSKKEHDEQVAKEQKLFQEEKIKQRNVLSNIKRQQRAEIYALNTILSEIEKSTYEKLKEEKGLPV